MHHIVSLVDLTWKDNVICTMLSYIFLFWNVGDYFITIIDIFTWTKNPVNHNYFSNIRHTAYACSVTWISCQMQNAIFIFILIAHIFSLQKKRESMNLQNTYWNTILNCPYKGYYIFRPSSLGLEAHKEPEGSFVKISLFAGKVEWL